MQIIDLEILKVSDALFNPRESSLFGDPGREGLLDHGSERTRDGSGATSGGRKKTEPKMSHGNGRPGGYDQRKTSDVARRPLGHRQKRRSPEICSWSSLVSEAKSLAEQIESYPHALRAAELAQLLCVSRVSIFKWAKSGRIPSFRVGTCVRFDPRAVAKWLRNM